MKAKKIILDKEEKDLLESFEKGEWKTINGVKKEINKYSTYAKSTLKKEKRINIRISQIDLDKIQRKAIEEGIPYQTLISSMIHKYNNGKLVEVK
ncbi:MAG: antitoxin [Leptospiraceae bacterium]|nr:antitoxin [Leptospiraceae bacterium]